MQNKKIRTKINKKISEVKSIDGLADILNSDPFAKAGRRMTVHLMVKIRRKASEMGYVVGFLDDEDEDLMTELADADVDLSKPVDLDALFERPAPAEPAPAEPAPAEPAPAEPSDFDGVSIADQVDAKTKAAMKARDKDLTSTLRLIKSGLAAGAKDEMVDQLEDDAAIKVLRKMAKQRQESIDMYESAGASDKASAERTELEVIAQWLPPLADEATTRAWIQVAIDEAGDGKLVPGKIMGQLMRHHREEIDGKMAKELCASMCAEASA